MIPCIAAKSFAASESFAPSAAYELATRHVSTIAATSQSKLVMEASVVGLVNKISHCRLYYLQSVLNKVVQ